MSKSELEKQVEKRGALFVGTKHEKDAYMVGGMVMALHLLEVAEFELDKHRLDIDDGPIDFFNGANEIVRALKSYCGRE